MNASQSVGVIVAAAGRFILGSVAAWAFLFLTHLLTGKADTREFLANLGMSVYLVMVAAIPAGAGYGIVAVLARPIRELSPRWFWIYSLAAGAISFSATFTGLTAYLYFYGSYLRLPGALLSMLLPGVLLGLIVVGIAKLGAPRLQKIPPPQG